MATIHSFFTGEISGRLGDKVYYQLNGKTCVRQLPGKRTKPATPEQVKSRQRFTSIMLYCRKFKYTVIPLVWNKVAASSSGWSAFMKANAPAFDKEGMLADVKLLRLSAGKLILPEEFTAKRTLEDPSVIEVSWKRDLNMGGVLLWDDLMALCSSGEEYSNVISTGIKRGELAGSFHLPVLNAQATHLFLFFASGDREDFTESVCFEI